MKRTANLRRKTQSGSKSKKSRLIKPKSKPKRKNTSDIRRTSFWSKEVALLRGQTFNSFDHALEALLDSVLTRLGATQEEQGPMRDFLMVLLSTDPELTDALSKSLKVKR